MPGPGLDVERPPRWPATQELRSRLAPKHAVAVVFVLSMFMTIMDGTIVNVALPTFGHDFGAPTSSVQWVVLGYLLSLALFIPASGWIGDRIGTKRTYLAAVVLFTGASALCASAHALGELVAFRVLQGAGGGLMLPVGTAMLFRAFPPAERANASRVLIIPTVLAPAVGPVLGGLLIDELSWRWIFTVNIPIGALALLFGTIFLTEHRQSPEGSFDPAGFLLSGGGLALLLYGVSEGPLVGWASPRVPTSMLLGALMLAVFVRHVGRRADPMLRLRLLSDRIFRASNLVSVFGFGAFMGVLFVTPLYLQEARGFSPFVSGLTTFPEAIGVISGSQVAARLYPGTGPRRLMLGGLVAVTGLLASFALLGSTTDLWFVRILMFAVGVGMAFVIMPLQAAAFATISPANTGHASAIFNTQRQVAAAVVVAILSTVLDTTGGRHIAPSASAFHPVFLVDAALCLVGVAMTFTVHDSDAAGTMRPRPTADTADAAA